MAITIDTKTCHTCIYQPEWHVTGYDADGNESYAGYCKRTLPVCDERGPLTWDEDNPLVGIRCPAWVRKSGAHDDKTTNKTEDDDNE